MKLDIGVVCLVMTIIISIPASAEQFKCEVGRKNWCDINGCKIIEVNDEFNTINLDERKYGLCESGKKECQTFDITYSRISGIFLNVGFGVGAFIKIAMQDEKLLLNIKKGEFIEVRSGMLGAMNSFGSCEKID